MQKNKGSKVDYSELLFTNQVIFWVEVFEVAICDLKLRLWPNFEVPIWNFKISMLSLSFPCRGESAVFE
jgi:hypothetical protein